ncbi:N(2),N(2)-dimethylguanosine tRNA methyltransferase, mitochondrial, putative [Candida maltosa Xu316]|uniref:tRNA (guanine(26)-N(2))-dimethyltransferase n=1 Tax=Candida maltosa (strain Xu316) TaxID=1245528 RepID=M3HN97_CANMX|nr:N(2),N(2)-dimethylguanosine tRNA methyltransferase, mitochondrial, putative [Candida maltosa Xu316]
MSTPTESTKSHIIKPSTTISSEFTTITEGKATILTPKKDEVFYNPIQQFNRDLSIMIIRAFQQMRQDNATTARKKKKLNGLKILEALSASGLRSCRYGLEIPEATKIVANDLSHDAVASITKNIEHNGLTDKVVANQGDAIKFMASTSEKFHVVDLDPYGTAAPFIDSAIQCLEDGGLLLVTCTDAGVLASAAYPEKCFSLYGGNNFGHNQENHEAGIRLILNLVATTAAKYGKSITPLLSLSIDYYYRLAIVVRHSPINVKKLSSQSGIVYSCTGCGTKQEQVLGVVNDNKYGYAKVRKGMINDDGSCRYCSRSINVTGPMSMMDIQDASFIERVKNMVNSVTIKSGEPKADKDKEVEEDECYGTTKRIHGMLSVAKSELNGVFDIINLNAVSKLFKTPPMPLSHFANAISNLGYHISLTHVKANSVKTDAPQELVFKIFEAWLIESNKLYIKEIESKPEEEITEKMKEKVEKIKNKHNHCHNEIGNNIITYLDTQNLDVEIDFETKTPESDKLEKLRKSGMVLFQENPRKNWGPQSMAKK